MTKFLIGLGLGVVLMQGSITLAFKHYGCTFTTPHPDCAALVWEASNG